MQKLSLPILPKPKNWFSKKHKIVEVKNCWNDLTLRDYVLINTFNSEDLIEFARVNLLTLSNLSFKEIDNYLNYPEILAQLLKPLEFMKTQPQPERISEFTFDGERFTLETFFGKEPQVKYILAESKILKVKGIMDSIAEGDFIYLPNLIAILVSPEGGFNMARITELTKKFERLPFMIALGICRFFFSISTLYNAGLQHYLIQNLNFKPQRNNITNVNTHGRA